MDPATIVAGVLGVLMPYVSKGAKELVNTVGEVGYQKAKALLDNLKARWAGDEEASNMLERFETKPDRYEPILESIMKEKIVQDHELAHELSDMLKDMGSTIQIIQDMDEAKGITGLEASEMQRGEASVTQRMKKAEGVIGAKIDHIG